MIQYELAIYVFSSNDAHWRILNPFFFFFILSSVEIIQHYETVYYYSIIFLLSFFVQCLKIRNFQCFYYSIPTKIQSINCNFCRSKNKGIFLWPSYVMTDQIDFQNKWKNKCFLSLCYLSFNLTICHLFLMKILKARLKKLINSLYGQSSQADTVCHVCY